MTFTKEERQRLLAGQPVDVAGHRYILCRDCGRIIKITGWLGSLHLCKEEGK